MPRRLFRRLAVAALAAVSRLFREPPLPPLCRGELSDARLRRDDLFLLFMSKGGLGDAFCQTGLMRALRAKHPEMRFVVVTRFPDFFLGLPEVAEIADISGWSAWCRCLLHTRLRVAALDRAHDFVYKPQRQVPKAWCDAHPGVRPHLIELAAANLRLPADFSDVRGRLAFSPGEERKFAAKHAALDADFAIVVPVGKTSYTPNKEWGFDNWRRLAELLPEIRWVQLGLAENPLLPGAIDLRGKTSLREMALALSRARFVVCGEGLHNHLCGALGTPCFTVFSGFHYPVA